MVARPSGGTLRGTIGLKLTNRENRQHNHSVNLGTVATTTIGSHVHQVDLPLTDTYSSGSHSHLWSSIGAETNWSTFGPSGSSTLMIEWNDGVDAEGIGMYPLGVFGAPTQAQNFYTNQLGSHTHQVDIGQFTASPSAGHDHTVDLPNAGTSNSATADVMPYIQLTACRKN